LSRDDIGPLIQDAVEYLVALYIENGNGPTSDPSINVLTGSVGPKFGNPRPKALPRFGYFRRALCSWI
jgi:hypothetical protein